MDLGPSHDNLLGPADADRERAGLPEVQVLVTAKNNAATIEELCECAKQFGRVIIVDSGSQDGTREIATAAGANVVTHPYVNASAQLNWALDNVVQADWCLILDTDERPRFTPDALAAEIRVADAASRDAIAIRRRNIAFGRWMRHGGWYPDWQVRVIKVAAHRRYEDLPIHAHVVVPRSRVHFSRLELDHQTYQTVDDYWRRFSAYTSKEASTHYSWSMTSARLRAGRLKVISRLIPGRVILWFVYRYLLRLGFLDGSAGWHLALWTSVYQDVVAAKRKEIKAATAIGKEPKRAR